AADVLLGRGGRTLPTIRGDQLNPAGGSAPHYWRYGRRDRHALLLKVVGSPAAGGHRLVENRTGRPASVRPGRRRACRGDPRGAGRVASAWFPGPRRPGDARDSGAYPGLRGISPARGYIAEPYVWRMFARRSSEQPADRGLSEG